MMNLVQRVERLERQNRTLRLAVFVLVLGGGAFLFGAMSNQPSQTVRAKKFELVNGEAVVGSWDCDLGFSTIKAGQYQLLEGNKIQGILHYDRGGRLALYDTDGKVRAQITGVLGASSLVLRDQRGRSGVELRTSDDGGGYIAVKDGSNKIVFEHVGDR